MRSLNHLPPIKPVNLAFALLLGLVIAFQLWGVQSIPFHPDESTFLYMSSDFETLLTDPRSMAWDPAKLGDLRQHYRLIDAPLGRYVLGLGRSLVGLPALASDWDWSQNWEQNVQRGALPGKDLLYTGRLFISLLLPISMLFLYLAGRLAGERLTGALAALLLGSNALVLLHGRRAMAEGVLIMGVTLCAWAFLQGDRRPWLAGIAAALAFNSKQSALALVPVGLLAVVWLAPATAQRLPRASLNAIQYLAVFGLFSLALNPVWWNHPLAAIQASWQERQQLLDQQTSLTRQLLPEQYLDTPGKKILALVANLYILPPSFHEVGNYTAETTASEMAYLATPGHNLMRGFIWGGLMLTITLVGIVLACVQAARGSAVQRRAILLLVMASLAQAAALVVAVPLPFQRYVIPLVPFVCLWTAYAAGQFLQIIFYRRQAAPLHQAF